MLPFKRASNNKLDRWFFTVNKPILLLVVILLIIGVVLNLTASPYVAIRLGVDSFYFFYRHIFYVVIALIVLIGTSFLSKKQVQKVAAIIFIVSTLAILLVLLLNVEVKGAKRWIYIFGISLQPSEFVKVCFPVVLASVWQQLSIKNKLSGYLTITVIYIITTGLIIMQPDLGMVILISLVFAAILFLVEVKLVWILLLAILGVISLVISYLVFSHVYYRIDSFFNSTKPYQVMKALEALQNGGFFGVGPGKGYFKQYLPDAHTDFIFAVAVEEYGLVFAFILLALFGYLFFLGFKVLQRVKTQFIYISIAGLLVLLMFQAFIHISSNINLIPTKGMTLPFISYGGTSLVANALLVGFLLALSKKEY